MNDMTLMMRQAYMAVSNVAPVRDLVRSFMNEFGP